MNKKNVILLEDAIPYFTSLIGHKPDDWDAYIRRAASEHAQNQRQAAIADYTSAIKLHPDEPFLYLRRGMKRLLAKFQSFWTQEKGCRAHHKSPQ